MHHRLKSYEDFKNQVSRYDPENILRAIGKLNQENLLQYAGKSPPTGKNPWQLAAIVRESIIVGLNRSKSPKVDENILDFLSELYFEVHEPMPGNDANQVLRILIRHQAEQFRYQQSDFEELARSIILFSGGGDSHSEAVREMFEKVFGFSAHTVVKSGIWMARIAQILEGYIDLESLNPIQRSALEESISIKDFEKIKKRFSITQRKFKDINAQLPSPKRNDGRRWRPNPLKIYPIIELEDGSHIAPVHILPRLRVRPEMLHADCKNEFGQEFTREFGMVLEEYVGKNLKLFKSETVWISHEIKWKKGLTESKSIDWFVVTPKYVVLIESKSMKLSFEAQMGEDEAHLHFEEHFDKATKKILETHSEILNGNQAFLDFPKDRQFIGLVSSFGNLWSDNLFLTQHTTAEHPFPIVSLSLRDLEAIVVHDADEVFDRVFAAFSTEEKSAWSFHKAVLKDLVNKRNPLLAKGYSEISGS